VAAAGVGSFDPVRAALTYVLRIAEQVRLCREQDGGGGVTGEAVRRRARDLPTLVASAGMVSALTFYMSKADSETLQTLLDRVLGGEGPSGELCGSLRGELGGGEGAGYSTLLALATRALEDMGYLGGVTGSSDTMTALARGLLSLRGTEKELVAERRLLEFLVEVKKLAEALLRDSSEEERGGPRQGGGG